MRHQVPSLETGTLLPLANQISFSRMASWVSMTAVTLECDEKSVVDKEFAACSQWTDVSKIARRGAPPVVTLPTLTGVIYNGQTSATRHDHFCDIRGAFPILVPSGQKESLLPLGATEQIAASLLCERSRRGISRFSLTRIEWALLMRDAAAWNFSSAFLRSVLGRAHQSIS
jgi:hypothetical protein